MIYLAHKDTGDIVHVDTSDTIHRDDGTLDIIAGIPLLGVPDIGHIYILTATSITTGLPELGDPNIYKNSLVANNILNQSPVFGVPTFRQIHNLTPISIVFGSPVLTSPILVSLDILMTTDIVTGIPILDNPDIAQTHGIFSTNIVLENPILGAPVVQHIFYADLNFNLPKTLCELTSGYDLIFDLPETLCEISVYSQIVTKLIGTIGKTVLNLEAVTDMCASVSFDIPISYMSAYTGAIIEMQYALSEMTSNAYTIPIIEINAEIPKTQIVFTSVNQSSTEINFTLPYSQMLGSVDVQNQAIISAQTGSANCIIAAVNNALAEIALTTPKVTADFIVQYNSDCQMSFSTPNVVFLSSVSTHSDGVLRHIRGAIR